MLYFCSILLYTSLYHVYFCNLKECCECGVFGVQGFSLQYSLHQEFRIRPVITAKNRYGTLRFDTTTSPELPRQSAGNGVMLSMVLLPLSASEVKSLISATGKPTSQQYQSYFGRTTLERYNRILEGLIVALIGCSMSYFMSFVMGSFIATCLGTASLLWGILSPELKAYQRNWELLGGRSVVDYENDAYDGSLREQRGLLGAVWMGHVADVCVVEGPAEADEYDMTDFCDYKMENDELEKYTGQPYLIRLLLKDDDSSRQSRELQVHARMSEEYLHIRKGLPIFSLLLCTDREFTKLAALTDVYVYDTATSSGVLVGDYPYLDRVGLEEFYRSNNYNLWDVFVSQKNVEPIYTEKTLRNKRTIPAKAKNVNETNTI